jgi:hypothetical protein
LIWTKNRMGFSRTQYLSGKRSHSDIENRRWRDLHVLTTSLRLIWDISRLDPRGVGQYLTNIFYGPISPGLISPGLLRNKWQHKKNCAEHRTKRIMLHKSSTLHGRLEFAEPVRSEQVAARPIIKILDATGEWIVQLFDSKIQTNPAPSRLIKVHNSDLIMLSAPSLAAAASGLH